MAEAPAAKPIRIALAGAGIYARNAHLPALLEQREAFEVAAVYSRTAAAAQALAAQAGSAIPIFTDFQQLFDAPGIEAVDILLPIPVQADFVNAALRAGKHVISEKPIAPDSATARALIDLHRRTPGQAWMVGENWRYEEAFERAADLVRQGAIGRPLSCYWAQFSSLKPGNPYYATAWRRSGFAGGLVLDGAVHLVAALRLVLGEIAQVTAATALFAADLPPVDSVAATLRFASGAIGALVVSYAAASPWGAPLTIVGERGSLRVQRGRVELTGADGAVEVIECGKLHGVQRELAAFAQAIRHGTPHRNPPEEALRDLEVIEQMVAPTQA